MCSCWRILQIVKILVEYQANIFRALIWLPYVKITSTAWLIIIQIYLSITLSLNCLSLTELPDLNTLKPFNIESRKKKSVIKTIHSTNVNSRTFWANRELVIIAVANAVGVISRWNEKKSLCCGDNSTISEKKS